MKICCELNNIQLRADHVWYWDEIGFDTNTTWNKVICTYKLFQGEKCWRWKLERDHHSGARYLYLPEMIGNASCHLSFYTKPRSTPKISTSTSHWNGKSITKNMGIWIDTGDLNHWHNSTTYVAPHLSTIRYFFNGHGIHLDDRALGQMKCRNIQIFVLKGGNSTNYQTNDNGSNTKLDPLYNDMKAAWILNYGTKEILPQHINSILVEAWYAFKVSDGNNIMGGFVKKFAPPSSLPN